MKKILFFICAVALLTSCGSKKRLPKTDGEEIAIVTDAEKTQYETLISKNFDFGNLSAKAKYSFNGTSLSGKFFVEHGKRLAMTMSVLGIEVVRVEADTKNVTLVNKFDKIYSVLSIDEFAEKFGMKDEMRYDALESILLGRMFVPGQGEATAKDIRHFALSFSTDGSLIGRINKEKYSLNYYSTPVVDANLAAVEVVAKNGDAERHISCNYENFVELGGGQFPTTSTLSLGLFDEKILASFSLSNPTLNAKPLAPFNPSSAYQQVPVKDFFEAIKNLKK